MHCNEHFCQSMTSTRNASCMMAPVKPVPGEERVNSSSITQLRKKKYGLIIRALSLVRNVERVSEGDYRSAEILLASALPHLSASREYCDTNL